MCLASVGVKVQPGVEWVEVCPALAYSLSSANARADAASLSTSEATTWHFLHSCFKRGQDD